MERSDRCSHRLVVVVEAILGVGRVCARIPRPRQACGHRGVREDEKAFKPRSLRQSHARFFGSGPPLCLVEAFAMSDRRRIRVSDV